MFNHSNPHRSQYSFLESAFDPCNKENLLVTGQLPGWEEGLIKRLCVVYDPHNILPAMFRRKEFQLHYIELIEDLVSFCCSMFVLYKFQTFTF